MVSKAVALYLLAMLKTLLLCLLLAMNASAIAQSLAINISDIKTQQDIYDQLFFYEDKERTMSIEELVSNNKLYFSKLNKTHTYGYSHSIFWFYNRISNPADKALNVFLKNIGSVNFLELYIVEKGQLIKQQIHGSLIPYEQPEHPYRDPVFEINLAPNTDYDLYLKYKTSTSYLITPTLLTPKKYNEERENSAYFYGAYFGVLSAILIYLLASAIISRQKMLVYYSLFLGGTIFINHAMLNFNAPLFGLTHSPNFIVAVSIVGCTLIVSFFEFCFNLFELKKFSPNFVTFIRRYFYAFVLFTIIFLLFGDLVIATQIYFIALLLTIFFGLIFLFFILKHKLDYAILFSTAWIGYYLSLTILNLAWTGVIDYKPNYLMYMYIATMIETIVFSFIVALRYQKIDIINDSKTELLATAGHDIRQPLQAMVLYKNALEHEVKTEQGQGLLASLNLSINALHQLLDKLLDVSNIETGKVKITKKHFEISKMVEDIVEGLGSVAINKNLELKIKVNSQVIFSDRVLLATIVRNILANALRYVDEGKILITGRKRQHAYLLQIWDTGDGIDAQKLTKIFERYFQMERFKKNEGIGLGLFICKQFSDKLDIDIHVKSKRMKGTVFSLWIKNDSKK